MTRAWLSGGSVPSGVRLFSVLPSSWAVASSLLRVQLAMSPAPTSATVTVCPKTGTATTTAAAHASTTHAAYLAASLRTSTALNPLLSMSEDAISPDAEADTHAGSADAGADGEAGTSWPAPFPEPSSRAPTKPLGATKVAPSHPPSELLTVPTAFNPSGCSERSQPSPPTRVKSVASATSLIPTDLFRRGLLLGESASTDSGALLGSPSVSGYPAAPAKARGNPSRARRKSSISWAALEYRSSGSLVKSPITRASIASGIEALRIVGRS